MPAACYIKAITKLFYSDDHSRCFSKCKCTKSSLLYVAEYIVNLVYVCAYDIELITN